MPKLFCLFLISIFIGVGFSVAQTCPDNIGFEKGDFSKWQSFAGSVTLDAAGANLVTVGKITPINGRHTIISKKTEKDYYGGFSTISPNGSNYAVKLGDDGTGKQAERLTYTIEVPANAENFGITYQYAVVFENPPGHSHSQQARFTANVLDLSTNNYIKCASFEYVATSNLPGFKQSPVKEGVLYKDWTSVFINLSDYKGKTLVLEFTTADCALSGHFGYAYVDVIDNCHDIIQGNSYCDSSNEINLTGPAGYEKYLWYNEDRSIKYGEGEKLVVKPALQPGKKVLLDLIPYEGFGCKNTVFTVIKKENFDFQLLAKTTICEGSSIDLTTDKILLNKSISTTYQFYANELLTTLVPEPNKIDKPGRYFVKAVGANGCSQVKFIDIILNESLKVEVLASINSCDNSPIDLTSHLVQKNVPSGVKVKYFENIELTKAVTDPKSIKKNGTYYLQFENETCTLFKTVTVQIFDKPVLKITNPDLACNTQTIDITDKKYKVGSDEDLTFSYFKDDSFKITLDNPSSVDQTGYYYIIAKNKNGCTVSNKIYVEFVSFPVLVVKNPVAVCAPNKVDLTNKGLYEGSTEALNFSFVDKLTGLKVQNPNAIASSGTFIITATNIAGCSVSKEITTTVNQKPSIVINQPSKAFIGQTIDLTSPLVTKGSTHFTKVGYWFDDKMRNKLDNPDKITKSGKYYISLSNLSGCDVVGEVEVELVSEPKIIVPTAFTPLKSTNNKLFPFIDGIQKLVSFRVYNKWGNLVYETSSAKDSDGWDGTYKNNLQPFETYSWFAEGISRIGKTFTNKGKTVLIP